MKVGVAIALGAVAFAAAFATLAPRLIYPSVSILPLSPSAVPGEHEVMYFGVETKKSDFRLQEIMFEVDSTDNASTGWNTCGQLGAVSGDPLAIDLERWSIYNSTLSTRLDTEASWNFYDSAMVNCADSSVADHVVAYAVTTTPMASVIPASTRSTTYADAYVVYVDTAGASASNDDSFRITVSNTPASMLWEDSHSAIQNARYITRLPLIGTTYIY